MKARILVIDDNPDIAHALKVLFTINQLDCDHCLTPEAVSYTHLTLPTIYSV